ncbi:hypothetical protein PGA7_00006230 [Porphyromonas gingivalis]|nr:hypothetical protein PGA7_00006230 [Porphyromonas gingivalis]
MKHFNFISLFSALALFFCVKIPLHNKKQRSLHLCRIYVQKRTALPFSSTGLRRMTIR